MSDRPICKPHREPVPLKRRLWGPMSFVGLVFAIMAFLGDQGFKLLMLAVIDFDNWPYRRIEIAPFLDIVLAWNRGISYGWFAQHSEAGRWLLIGFTTLVTLGLWLWLAQQKRPLPAAALGLIIGGAMANILDRVVHGAVADFFWFHMGRFSWYVFNLADVAIVAGALLILYDSLVGEDDAPSREADERN